MSSNQPAPGPGGASKRMSAISIGWVVLAVLLALTVLEYFVFLWVDRNFPIMILMNVIDAALILVYFMHLPRAWRSGHEEGH